MPGKSKFLPLVIVLAMLVLAIWVEETLAERFFSTLAGWWQVIV